uniref:Uncharacterized protein n=1 Tax=Anguilla anguilla TaxID=7936 RepID=A0A0E9U782_ANGAN
MTMKPISLWIPSYSWCFFSNPISQICTSTKCLAHAKAFQTNGVKHDILVKASGESPPYADNIKTMQNAVSCP